MTPGFEKNCKHCGTQFYAYQSKVEKGEHVYCSRRCYFAQKHIDTRVILVCQHCGGDFVVDKWKAAQKFCSRPCVDASLRYDLTRHKDLIETAWSANNRTAKKAEYQSFRRFYGFGLSGASIKLRIMHAQQVMSKKMLRGQIDKQKYIAKSKLIKKGFTHEAFLD